MRIACSRGGKFCEALQERACRCCAKHGLGFYNTLPRGYLFMCDVPECNWYKWVYCKVPSIRNSINQEGIGQVCVREKSRKEEWRGKAGLVLVLVV